MLDVVIETPRLFLRPFTLEDVDAVFRLSSNQKVTKYTGDAGKIKTLQDAQNIIETIWLREYRSIGYGRLAVVSKSNNQVIGFSGLKYLPEEQLPDLGYRLLPEYWGQGIGYECAKAGLDYGFEKLKLATIIAMADIKNIGSNRILSKLGFENLGQQQYQGFEIFRYQIESPNF